MLPFKSVIRTALASSGAMRLCWPLMRGRATIFMLHRLSAPERGIVGHRPEVLRAFLEALRQERYSLLPVREIVTGLRAGTTWKTPAVGFTIDDGYWEQAHVAAPIFSSFDCPVTTFVTTGFLDGSVWLWWDQLEYIIEHTTKRSVYFSLNGVEQVLAWQDRASRDAELARLTDQCKKIPDEAMRAGIGAFAKASEVELPSAPPPRYAPMTWGDLRAAERGGMQFGAHTLTHPVLSRTSDRQAQSEIVESWSRLRAMASAPVPIFAYPNGMADDFGSREIAACRESGLEGSLVSAIGYAEIDAAPDTPYLLRRFPYIQSGTAALECVSGLERLKALLQQR